MGGADPAGQKPDLLSGGHTKKAEGLEVTDDVSIIEQLGSP